MLEPSGLTEGSEDMVETTTAAGPGQRDWIGFDTDPGRYRHWRLHVDGSVATLALDTDEDGGLQPGYALKLNSYDLGVDIELHDAVQRLRFEHPEVRAVILTSAKEGVFCAGANIKMLAQASHPLKVNFCKFTNETRLAIERASAAAARSSGAWWTSWCPAAPWRRSPGSGPRSWRRGPTAQPAPRASRCRRWSATSSRTASSTRIWSSRSTASSALPP